MTTATPTPARALAPRALYQDVAERLRQQIFARELEPGGWIDEQKLAAEYGISRTPLREALKVLAAEGLVTMKVRRGAYVSEMSREDVRQIYGLLGLLEADAAAEAATIAGDEQFAELQRLHDRLEKLAHRREAFFAANEAFHLALLDVAGNRWRRQIVVDLRRMMKLDRRHSLLERGRLADSLAEHRVLMAALAARNPSAAADAMRAHFAGSLEVVDR